MSDDPDWDEIRDLLNALYSATDRLEAIFPGRKFTLDGHLVGSIGEVLASYMFDLELNAASTKGHDAVARDGRRVEVKFTQGKTVAIRHEPDHLLVLQRPKQGRVELIFNGPGALAWNEAGRRASNGQRPISLARLRRLDEDVQPDARLMLVREPPI